MISRSDAWTDVKRAAQAVVRSRTQGTLPEFTQAMIRHDYPTLSIVDLYREISRRDAKRRGWT